MSGFDVPTGRLGEIAELLLIISMYRSILLIPKSCSLSIRVLLEVGEHLVCVGFSISALGVGMLPLIHLGAIHQNCILILLGEHCNFVVAVFNDGLGQGSCSPFFILKLPSNSAILFVDLLASISRRTTSFL